MVQAHDISGGIHFYRGEHTKSIWDDARWPILAGQVLTLASLLAPDGIPRSLFTSNPVSDFLAVKLPTPDPDATSEALSLLHRFSLVSNGAPDRPVIHVHAAVQRAVRENTDDHTLDDACVAAASGLMAVWPELAAAAAGLGSVNTPQRHERSEIGLLIANAHRLLRVRPDPLWSQRAHPLVTQLGRSLIVLGLAPQAVAYFDAAVETAHKCLGESSADTLLLRSDLAHAKGQAGSPLVASAESEAVLADCRRHLDATDPVTLIAMRRLADWHGETGDYAGSVLLFEELLAESLRQRGPDDRETLYLQHHIAYLHGEAGEPKMLSERFKIFFRHTSPSSDRTISTL